MPATAGPYPPTGMSMTGELAASWLPRGRPAGPRYQSVIFGRRSGGYGSELRLYFVGGFDGPAGFGVQPIPLVRAVYIVRAAHIRAIAAEFRAIPRVSAHLATARQGAATTRPSPIAGDSDAKAS